MENLQTRRKCVPLQCVFHSIRFKVNKGWAQRSPFFMPVPLLPPASPHRARKAAPVAFQRQHGSLPTPARWRFNPSNTLFKTLQATFIFHPQMTRMTQILIFYPRNPCHLRMKNFFPTPPQKFPHKPARKAGKAGQRGIKKQDTGLTACILQMMLCKHQKGNCPLWNANYQFSFFISK